MRNQTVENIFEMIHMTDLTEREKDVLCMRLSGWTLDEISKVMKPMKEFKGKVVDGHIDRERVRQIEAKAVRKLRHPSRFGRKGGK